MIHPVPSDLNQALMKLLSTSDNLENVEESLKFLLDRFLNEKDEPMKNSLLLFVSSFSERIFKNNLFLFDKFMEKIIGNVPQCSFVFQGQIYVQLTTIILSLDLIHTNREAFEKFVNELIVIISKENQSEDRVLRQMSGECLNELEYHYPGLLEQHMKYLFMLCQKECTHALQSYVNLLMRILLNRIRLAALGGSSHHRSMSSGEISTLSGESLSSTLSGSGGSSLKFQSFNVPKNIFGYQELEIIPPGEFEKLRLSSSKRIQRLVKDTRKILSFVMSASRYFTVWGKVEVMRELFDIVKFSDFPLDAIRSEFFRKCVYNNNIYMVHAFTEMQKNFEFEGVSKERNGRCISISQDYLLSPFYRQLGSLLISKIPKKVNDLCPTVHDNLILIHTKLLKLVYSLSSSPSSNTIRKCLAIISNYDYYFEKKKANLNSSNQNSSMKKKTKPNQRLLIIFDFLYKILDIYPSSKSTVLNYLLNLIRMKPKIMIFWLIKFIDRFEEEHVNRSIQQSVLKTLEKKINFTHSTFLSYVPLIQRILSDAQFHPDDLLSQIDKFIKGIDPVIGTYSTSRDISKSGNWKMGRASLDCLKTAIRTHKSKILNQVNPTLQFMSKYYENEDVRDHAFLLFKLINHIPKNQLQYFISSSTNLKNIKKSTLKEEEEEENQENNISKKLKKKKTERIDDLDSYEKANLSLQEKSFEPFLKLRRVQIENEDELNFQNNSSVKNKETENTKKKNNGRVFRVSDMETYNQILFEFSEPSGLEIDENISQITLFFEICFDTITEEPEIDTIYSMRIFFPKLPQFEEIEEIQIPYLRSFRKNGFSSSLETKLKDLSNINNNNNNHLLGKKAGVGCSYFFRLPIHPLFPVSSVFKDIKVEFSTKKHSKCVTTIPITQVNLTDFFKPLPIQVTNISDFWKLLWKNGRFYESVKILNWRKYELERFVGKKLSEFVIQLSKKIDSLVVEIEEDEDSNGSGIEEEEEEEDDHEDDEEDEVKFRVETKKENIEIKKVLIFLPPRYHLLLWFIVGEMNTKVKIKTDFFQILAYIDEFFNTF